MTSRKLNNDQAFLILKTTAIEKVRIDKWLWSVRILKSRSKSTEACKSGKVLVEGTRVKPSFLIARGDRITVKKQGFNFEYRVLDLLDKRVGAPVAQTCYTDLTPEEELHKYDAWFVSKKKSEFRQKGLGRPTKKHRREIDKLKDH